jgi:hypothetical protein
VHQVDAVYAELHDRQEGALIGLQAPGIGREVLYGVHRKVDLHADDFAQPAFLQHATGLSRASTTAHVVSHHQEPVGGFGRLDHGPAVGHRIGDGFLDEYVEPRLEGRLGLGPMQGIGGRQDDGLQIVAPEQRLVGGRRVAPESLCRLMHGGLVNIVHGPQVHDLCILDGVLNRVAVAACANQRETYG